MSKPLILIVIAQLLLSIKLILSLKEKEKVINTKKNDFQEQTDYLLEEIERLKEKERLFLSGQESRMQAEIAKLDVEYHRIREGYESDLRDKERKTKEEYEKFKKEYEEAIQELEADKEIILASLEDLKSKKAKSIELLREEEKKDNKIDFHRINLRAEEREDIKILLEVEKRIHNKDVLRKLIYKTYVESAMNETFNRIGVITEPGIYKIENIQNGKTYIGQSTNVRNRLREHVKASLGISSIANQAVHEAMNEEGLDSFTFEVIESCEREQLNNREKYWIEFHQSNEWGYNRTRGNR